MNFESSTAAEQSRADNKILGHDLNCGHFVSDGYHSLSSGSLSDLVKMESSDLDGDSPGAPNYDCTNSVTFGHIANTCGALLFFNFSSSRSNIIQSNHS